MDETRTALSHLLPTVPLPYLQSLITTRLPFAINCVLKSISVTVCAVRMEIRRVPGGNGRLWQNWAKNMKFWRQKFKNGGLFLHV